MDEESIFNVMINFYENSEINLQSLEIWHQGSFNSNFQVPDQNFNETERKLTQKRRKPRKINQTSKWSPLHELKFWMFFYRLIVQNGANQISWRHQQFDNTFVKMGKYIGKTRNQCKTFNQRMKKKYYEDQDKDISQVVNDLLENSLSKNEEFLEEIKQIKQIQEEKEEEKNIYQGFFKNNSDFQGQLMKLKNQG